MAKGINNLVEAHELERADQVAANRRLAEDRQCAQPMCGGST